MNRLVAVFTLFIACLLLAPAYGMAAPAQLQSLDNIRQDGMNRISFAFDRIPSFDVEPSGQRVRIVMENTALDQSFRTPAGRDLYEPLVQVVADSHEHDSVIELYFRNFPENVDVSVDHDRQRFHVNVFFRPDTRGARPGILDERIGRLRPIESGAAARRVIESDFEGRWIEFFDAFEWPPDISLPVSFSLPDYPGPFVSSHADRLPEDIFDYSIRKLCELLESEQAAALSASSGGGTGGPASAADADARLLPAMAADIVRAKCLLHQGGTQSAMELLNKPIDAAAGRLDPDAAGWRAYLHAWAKAASGRTHRAAELLDRRREIISGANGIEPWHRLLQAEVDLANGKPEAAMERLRQVTDPAGNPAGRLGRIVRLRTGDTYYSRGMYDEAFDQYEGVADDLHFMRKYPESMANRAGVLYRRGAFEAAARHYALLSDRIASAHPELRALADYWAAMALYRDGSRSRAVVSLWTLEAENPETDAAFRSKLKLIDMEVLVGSNPPLDSLIEQFGEIARNGPTRQVREEAFFKKALACHLEGDDVKAVKYLGRFFRDFRAGTLQPEAAALLVELMPGAVSEMVEDGAYFEALALVARHRELLAQARITYDFLHRLAESYVNAGFLDHAERTYLYILDFEKDRNRHATVFLPLIRICFQQEKYRKAIEYASVYLEDYPEGADRTDVFYYYAGSLYRSGDPENAARVLHEQERPACPRLDALTGRVFSDMEKNPLALEYFSKAVEAGDSDQWVDVNEINLRRAEMLLADGRSLEALELYESLLADSRFRGQAGYRMIQILFGEGENRRALNIYDELAETDIEEHWLRMARETARSGNHINGRQ